MSYMNLKYNELQLVIKTTITSIYVYLIVTENIVLSIHLL